MTVLLDTQCWLWMDGDPDRLSSPVRRRLRSASTVIHVSVASIWELAIKAGLKRFDFKTTPELAVRQMLYDTEATLLGVQVAHVLAVMDLPHLHRDPFDRLLIAQAKIDKLTLVTADPAILGYDVKTIDARK